MDQSEQPPKETSAITAEEVKRQQQERLERAITPQGVPFSGSRKAYRPLPPPTDWRLWRNLPDVALWEACLLSLNINPAEVEQSSDGCITGDSFPSDGTAREYETRLRLLASNRDDSEHFTLPAVRRTTARSRVRLPEFAAWALHLGFEDVPSELVALAEKPLAPPDATTLAAPVPQAASVVTAGASGGVERVPENPWLVADPKDPEPAQFWYTPARYFARELIRDDSTLLVKKLVLADKVSRSLSGVGIFKRGGKKEFAAETILKAFSNVNLG